MRVWLVQRAESTPHDDNGDRRLLRIGILADILSSQGHEVVWIFLLGVGRSVRLLHPLRLHQNSTGLQVSNGGGSSRA